MFRCFAHCPVGKIKGARDGPRRYRCWSIGLQELAGQQVTSLRAKGKHSTYKLTTVPSRGAVVLRPLPLRLQMSVAALARFDLNPQSQTADPSGLRANLSYRS